MLRMKRETRVCPGVLPLPLDTPDEAEGIARSEEKPNSEDLLSAGARQMLHAALEIEVKAASRTLRARSKIWYTDKRSEMVTIYPKSVKDDLSTKEEFGPDIPDNIDTSQSTFVRRFPSHQDGFPARLIKSFSL